MVGTRFLLVRSEFFSPANFNQSRCRILVFASRRANKITKWKIGFREREILQVPAVRKLVTNGNDAFQNSTFIAIGFNCVTARFKVST